MLGKVRHSGGLGQLLGLVCNRTHVQASRRKAAYVEIATCTCIPKVLQDPLKSKEITE